MKYLLITITLLGLTGCFPRMQNRIPEVILQVVDAKSLKPMANVLSSESIQSDKFGKMNMPVKKELGIALPVSGVYVIGRRFAVGKKGYASQVCECNSLTIHAKCEPYTLTLDSSKSDEEVTVQSLKDLVERSKKRFYDKPNPYALPIHRNGETVCSGGK
jgi:hypothetical protein